MADVKNVFVLMLENRSFDHMLGFSAITGFDAANGAPTAIDGLDGTQSNQFRGQTYAAKHPAPDTMPVDPGYEFRDVEIQLYGQDVADARGGAYHCASSPIRLVLNYFRKKKANPRIRKTLFVSRESG